MKIAPKTLLLLLAVAAVTLNVHCGDSEHAAPPATSALISLRPSADEILSETSSRNYMKLLIKNYVFLGKRTDVLRRSVNDDVDDDGSRRDRIRQCRYFTEDVDGIIKNLRRDLQITAIPKTNLISVSLTLSRPSERAEITNAVADAIVAEAFKSYQRKIRMYMENLEEKLAGLQAQIAAKHRAIEQIRGQGPALLMTARRKTLYDPLATLFNKLTSLRLQKARAEADLENFTERQRSGELAKSPEIRSAIARGPVVTQLRAAILKVKIPALGDKRNKQLPITQEKLEEMLTARQQDAARKAIGLKLRKLEAEVTSVSERLLATGNQYKEESARLRDLGLSLRSIEELQSGIARIQQQIRKVEDKLLRQSILLAEPPLAIQSMAEIAVED